MPARGGVAGFLGILFRVLQDSHVFCCCVRTCSCRKLCTTDHLCTRQFLLSGQQLVLLFYRYYFIDLSSCFRLSEHSQNSFHHARCYVPPEVKYVLDQKPSLISPIVQAFYERDPIDMKVWYAVTVVNYHLLGNRSWEIAYIPVLLQQYHLI